MWVILVLLLSASSCHAARLRNPKLASWNTLESVRSRFHSVSTLIREAGGFVHDSLYVRNVPGKGWGLYLRHALRKHERLLSIPLSLSLSRQSFPDYLRRVEHQHSGDGDVSFEDIMSYFAAVKLHAASTDADVPAGLKTIGPDCLGGHDMKAAVERLWPSGSWESAFTFLEHDRAAFDVLQRALGTSVSFDDYQFSLCLLRNRAFKVRSKGAEVNAELRRRFGPSIVVPLGDLMNHDRVFANAAYVIDSSGDSLHFLTLERVAASTEVTIRYHDKCLPPLVSLAYHGFWDPSDSVCLSVDLYGSPLTFFHARKHPLWWSKQHMSPGMTISGSYKRLVEVIDRHILYYNSNMDQAQKQLETFPQLASYWNHSVSFLEFARSRAIAALRPLKD